MKGQRVGKGLFLSLAVGVITLCGACKDGHEKCKIEISATGPTASCDVNKRNDDRIVWVNKDGQKQDLFVCAVDPRHSVFEAFAWYVPYRSDENTVNSGRIRNSFKPDFPPTEEFDYYVSTTPCGPYATTPDQTSPQIRTNPKIIIKGSN